MNLLSSHNRKFLLERLSGEYFDVVIIGGGITGAGIALDAASRGMKVALLEKHDFAAGTSSRSTKLIHGGLRYLKQFEVNLVREVGSERAIIHRLAPHLVRAEKMLLPIIKNGTYGKILTSFGLMVYDVLAGVEKEDQRVMLNKQQTLNLEPLLREDILEGGGIYAEYRTDDARLTIEVIKTANKFGALTANYAKVEDFLYEKNKVCGVQVQDQISQRKFNIKARYVVNAAGAWVDQLRQQNQSLEGKHLFLSKGVHIVVPHHRLPVQQAIYFDVPDGRMIFAIPRANITYIGTTDTPYKGKAEEVKTYLHEVEYLIDATNNIFPNVNLSVQDVIGNWAGLRPLIHEEGKPVGEISRKDEIFESETGLISIAGGKLTGYRKMAEKVVHKLAKKIQDDYGVQLKECSTDKIILTGGIFKKAKNVHNYTEKVFERILNWGLTRQDAHYLVSHYGKQTKHILAICQNIDTPDPAVRLALAELIYGIENEQVMFPEDFFMRRTGKYYFDIANVQRCYQSILDKFAEVFLWEKAFLEQQRQEVEKRIYEASNFSKKSLDFS